MFTLPLLNDVKYDETFIEACKILTCLQMLRVTAGLLLQSEMNLIIVLTHARSFY